MAAKAGQKRPKYNTKYADEQRRQHREQSCEQLMHELETTEDWLMDNPFNHPDYQNKVYHRNNLLIKIEHHETANSRKTW